MNNLGQKYGTKENEKVKAFHRSRRMFCVFHGKLFIANPNVSYSHATWFENEGWMTKENDQLINEITRGMIDEKGNIHFYTGYDFGINDTIESDFFAHLGELVKKLDLDIDAQIYGGLVKSKPGEIWPPAKRYGKIERHLK